MRARRVDPRSLASLAAQMVLLAPVAVARALALTLSTAVLTTTLTTFSPLLRVMAGRRQTGD